MKEAQVVPADGDCRSLPRSDSMRILTDCARTMRRLYVADMNVSRLFIALAILTAFVAGIATGWFLGVVPVASVRANALVSHLDPLRSADVRDEAPQTRGEDQMANGVVPEELLLRVCATLNLQDENTRHREWLNLIPLLTGADAAHVRDLFRKLKAEGRHFDFEWATFWPRWGEVDGAGALEHIRMSEGGDVQPALAEMIVRGWTKTNSEVAREWLTANPSAPFFGAALRGYVDGLARRDLARATRDALSMARGRDMSEYMEVLVEQALQQRQLEGMLEWWKTLPDESSDGSARLSAVAPIMSRLSEADPVRAQTWVTELADTPYRDEGSIGVVAEKLAENDAPGAVAWVASLPPSADGHYTGIGRSIRAWAANDKASLDRWLAGLPPSPLRDQAVAAQQEQTFVVFDQIEAHTQLDRAVRIFMAPSGAQIKGLKVRNGTLDITTPK